MHRTRPARSLTTTIPSTILAAALAVAVAGCAGAAPEAPPDAPAVRTSDVMVAQIRFDPRSVEVAPGTTVTWRFDDNGVPHDVAGDGFTSDKLTTGTFTHRFTEPGTYAYRCTLHPGMVGTVVVKG